MSPPAHPVMRPVFLLFYHILAVTYTVRSIARKRCQGPYRISISAWSGGYAQDMRYSEKVRTHGLIVEASAG
jgi:hypothetical protein